MSQQPYFTSRYIDQPLTALRFRTRLSPVSLARDVDDRLMECLRTPGTFEALARVKVTVHPACFDDTRYTDTPKAYTGLRLSPVKDAQGNVPQAFTDMVAALDAATEEGRFHRVRPRLLGGYEGDAAYGAKDGATLLAAVEKALGTPQQQIDSMAAKYFEPREQAQGRSR